MNAEVWQTRDDIPRLADELAGYHVESRDGSIGTVDRVSYSGNCFFVSAGRIRKHRTVIPAGAVERVDRDSRVIYVGVTNEELELAPAYDFNRGFDDEFERHAGAYYSGLLRRQGGDPERTS